MTTASELFDDVPRITPSADRPGAGAAARALALSGRDSEVIAFRAPHLDEAALGFVGTSRAMQGLREQLRRVASSDRPVLVRGPTGAGKELAVGAVHALGRRPDAALLDLNCGAFPASLVESQLFGHERGAFTGAERRHDGCFAAVGPGTLFLDEIGELPLELQPKLLRVLESGTFRPVGATAAQQFVGRVVAATHVDLEAGVEAGTFREDLLYRLNVLEVRVPGLEERREDIPELVAHFARLAGGTLRFTGEALAYLAAARWPGNVRQLRNLVDRLAVLAPPGPITPAVVAEISGREVSRTRGPTLRELAREVLRSPHHDKLELVESAVIDEALHLCGGNKTATARLLGVHRKVIERRVGSSKSPATKS
jgi:DNA-binding NtrC family response regulator